MLIHLGVGPNLTVSTRKQAKLKAKRQTLRKALSEAKARLDEHLSAESALLHAIALIESSGRANAGIGCALNFEGQAELEASFAGLSDESGGMKFASVTAVPFADSSPCHASELAYSLYRRQVQFVNQQTQATRPPLMLSGAKAFDLASLQQPTSMLEGFASEKKLARCAKKK